MKRGLLILALLVAAMPAMSEAQRGQGRAGLGRRGAVQGDSANRNRAMLEDQVRRRFAQVLKNQLGVTDQQLERVLDINSRYSVRRRELLQEEREVRMSLRREVAAGDSTRQGQVAALLDRMLAAQRQRIDVLEQEQRELAGVLTPMQRASYFGIEEQIRQRIEGMRGGRAGAPPPGDSAGLRPGGRGGRRGPPPPG